MTFVLDCIAWIQKGGTNLGFWNQNNKVIYCNIQKLIKNSQLKFTLVLYNVAAAIVVTKFYL